MSKSAVFGLIALFCLHSAVLAQSPSTPTASGQSGASISGASTSSISANRLSSTRISQARMTSQRFQSPTQSLTRDNSDRFRWISGRMQNRQRVTDRRRSSEPTGAVAVQPFARVQGTRTDPAFTRRMAQIDKLRDQALATGNVALLDQADAMENLALFEICGWKDPKQKKRYTPATMLGASSPVGTYGQGAIGGGGPGIPAVGGFGAAQVGGYFGPGAGGGGQGAGGSGQGPAMFEICGWKDPNQKKRFTPQNLLER